MLLLGEFMSEILKGVLEIPPHLWSDSPLDQMQRYDRYKEASKRIEILEDALRRIGSIDWGYDGDCGAQTIIDSVLDT